jgi:C4-dicarboxylate-specific signal transduction histidine kinase
MLNNKSLLNADFQAKIFTFAGIYTSLITPALIAPPVCIILLRTVNLLYQARLDLLKAQEELEKKVAESTEELRNANELLKDEIDERKKMEALLIRAKKMEAVGMLAGGVAWRSS